MVFFQLIDHRGTRGVLPFELLTFLQSYGLFEKYCTTNVRGVHFSNLDCKEKKMLAADILNQVALEF